MAIETIDRAFVRAALPARREDGHKGDFGKLLIVGGAVGYTGAPYLAAEAAARSGCGLIYLGVPRCIWDVEAVKCACAMPFPLPDDGERLSFDALQAIQARLPGCGVLALGPGLGRGAALDRLVGALLRETAQSVVLDADGLNALASDLSALDARRGRTTVLTPHDGEFSRLLGVSLDELQKMDRAETARRFAVEHGCVLVRKGHRTLVALPDGAVLENTCGGSELAKGGSGDVLTGMTASLLAQGADAERAAACAVWLHARAGELLAREKTAYCVTPELLFTEGLARAFSECVGNG
ncbi:MAG: NAD(P)H-hydrate dehydratase [Oscillospiraceae bacterium]|nr:NAD(P)H-hydrate dehydratase [Oscillospiraceae bacterium]